MRVLVIGRGPVAQVLATSMAPAHQVTLAVREPAAGTLLVTTNRRRPARRVERRVDVVPLDGPARDWDVVLSTAPPGAPEVARLLGRPAAVVAAVTQVPSEVAALRELAGDRPWGLVAPEFFATAQGEWWQPGRFRFTTAGPAATSLRPLLARSRSAPAFAPLMTAATTMPVVAGLHAADFELAVARRDARSLAIAATQARSAVAAEFGRNPAAVRPASVRAALTLLPRLMPFDASQYLRSHFGGHSAQTILMLRDWIALGRRHDRPTDALERLLAGLSPAEVAE